MAVKTTRKRGARERDLILERIGKINVWSRGDQRAPHKPLLLLLALGELSRGNEALPFSKFEKPLTELLKEFGPTRAAHHPEYPFWRLQNDELWQVESNRSLVPRKSNTDPPKSQLRLGNAVGRFPEKVRRQLLAEPCLVSEVAQRLLSAHFPESLHQDILGAVGLSVDRVSSCRRPRDPSFRERVLMAYGYRCALCGLDLRILNRTVALDAAHIEWFQAGGPDTVTNGVALCSLHHKIFDLGALTIHTDHRVLISEQVHGTNQLSAALLRYHGRQIELPERPDYVPAEKHLKWHRSEVFKEGPRPLQKPPFTRR